MVDIDGHFTYSSSILIKNPNAAQHVWVGNNPFHDVINIHLSKMPQQSVKVELMNVAGATVFHKEHTAILMI